mgnify:CR=1|jgi:hypothetical protein
MRVTTRAVRDLARNAGIPEETIERHLDLLINFTFAVAHRERKACRAQLRKWIHSDDVIKPPLLEVLKERDDTDIAPL